MTLPADTIALALDTSGDSGSVALLRGRPDAPPDVLATEPIGSGMRRGTDLFPALERCLARAGIGPREIGLVAVGTGPGSYTGLRVGVTAARAFAWASGARLLGVPSCDAHAAQTAPSCEGEHLAVISDSRTGAVYCAVYRAAADGRRDGPGGASVSGRWMRITGPELLTPDEAAQRLPSGTRIVGDGAAAHAAAFAAALAASAARPTPGQADAEHVGRLALARDLSGERGAIDAVVPLYLREFVPKVPAGRPISELDAPAPHTDRKGDTHHG